MFLLVVLIFWTLVLSKSIHSLMLDWHDGRCYGVLFLMWNCPRIKWFSKSHDFTSCHVFTVVSSVSFGTARQAGMSQCSSFVRNISHTELSKNLFCLRCPLKVSSAFGVPQQVCTGDGDKRVEVCRHMGLASAYSPALQIRLCCLLAPTHWPLGAMATQPSLALTIRSFLGWQDGAGCWILVTVLDLLSPIKQPDR